MKIRRLDLIAYGPFTNETMEFNADNLHVIYGPNEAGKSTALRALQAVLYGMTEKRDAFLHPWEMMRVGMSVEVGNQVIAVERRKGKGVRSLVYAGTDRAVTGEEWNRVLPVLDQNLFVQMFGLDYQRLVEGGRELAEGKGDIGQALLAAAGDLGNAVERMHAFQRRSSELFQVHARSQSKLSVAFRQYKEADRRIRSERFSSHAYRAAVQELEDKQHESERLTSEIRAGAAEHAALTRLRQAAPGVALLQEKERDLDAMSAVALLPTDFAARHEEAMKLLGKAVTTVDNSQAELDRLTQKLAGTPQEPALAELKINIETLFAQSGKIDAAREDRPKREGELRLLRERVTRNLRQLGLDLDPADCVALRVKVLQRSEINRLAEEHPRLTALFGEAGKNLDKLRGSVYENQQEMQQLPACPDTAELERCVVGLAGMPAEKDAAKTRAQVIGAEIRAEADLKALPLFDGTGEQLEQLQVPLAATVRAYQTRYTQQEAVEQQLETDEADARTEIASLEQNLRHLEDRGEVPTNAHLENSRSRRELGWTAVKRRWLKGEPDAAAETGFLSGAGSGQELDTAYEGAVQDADHIADRLRADADLVQKKALWLEQIARSDKKLQQARNAIEQAGTGRRNLDEEWRSLWAPTGIEPRTPVEMLDWLEARRDVVDALRNAGGFRRDLAETEAQLRSWQEALEAALASLQANATGSLAELIHEARNIVERADDTRIRRRDLEKEQRRLESERLKVEARRSQLQDAIADWDKQWAAAVDGLPVPEGAKPDTVQEVVRLLDEIAADAEQINGLIHRIETMQRDDEAFSAEVGRMVARSDISAEPADALIVVKKLHHAAIVAKQNEEAAALLRQDIEDTRNRLTKAQAGAERQRDRLAALCSEAGVDQPDSLGAAIENSSRKRELSKQIADQRKALAGACAGRSLEELINAVNDLNIDLVPARLKEFEDKQQEYENQKQECSRRMLELEHEFQVHESAATLSQAAAEKQDAGARILDLSEQYLEQEIAGRLLSAAIERYRSRHQDPLLERAGHYLEKLTCGSFAGLAVDFEEGNRRVLRAMRKDSGEHVDVTGMSDGARDQLFFALRLAYIEDHCARIGTCPVILDDVLMAFDNDRAVAALQVLSELAKRTQVLLFTHHLHHVELACQVLDKDRFTVHRLAVVQPTMA
jgi:uncharacterized protein YhaN